MDGRSGDTALQEHDQVETHRWAALTTTCLHILIDHCMLGLHKHFRMISIHNNMRSHGFVTENTPHTRIPGIWRKLDQLYDLQALDEREVAWEFREEPDPNDPDEAYDCADFELPEEDFGELMWQKRFHSTNSEVSSSPPVIPMEEDKALYHPGAGLLSGLPEGAKSQKAESVSGATPTPKIAKPGTRSGRAAARGGRNTKGGQAAKNSKAQSAVSESADEEDEDDDEEEDSVESEEETAPTTRKTNRSSGRTRPPTRRTRKR